MGYAIGKRRYARETYPETGSGAGEPALARNSAIGPGTDQTPTLVTHAQIFWSSAEVGAVPNIDVPITPKLTGIVRVVAMVGVANIADVSDVVTVTLQVNGTDVPGASTASAQVHNDANAEIPFTFDIWGGTGGTHPSPLPLSTSQISLLVSWGNLGGITILENQCSIDIQELPAVTG